MATDFLTSHPAGLCLSKIETWHWLETNILLILWGKLQRWFSFFLQRAFSESNQWKTTRIHIWKRERPSERWGWLIPFILVEVNILLAQRGLYLGWNQMKWFFLPAFCFVGVVLQINSNPYFYKNQCRFPLMLCIVL